MLTDDTKPIAEHALAYLQRGWHLVMMAHGTKGPTHKNWNSPAELVDDPAKAIARLQSGPQNMGLVHNASGTCAIDVDDEAFTRHIWGEFGLDYDAILSAGCRIWSKPNRDKVIFRAPADLNIVQVKWIKQHPKSPNDRQAIFELRAGPNQDVLPPSKHPDGHAYQWHPGTAPWEFEGDIPEIPAELLAFWRLIADSKSGLREAVEDLCPWKRAHVGRVPVQKPRVVSAEHQDVIGAFNRANDVGDMLEAHGYKRRGKRYLAPSSSTVIPGVVVLDGKCFSHHGSDPLGDGYAHDAFDLLVTLGHGGDVGAAVRDAANQLGIDRRPPPAPEVVIDLAKALANQAKRKQHHSQEVGTASTGEASRAVCDTRSCDDFSIRETRKTPDQLLAPPGIVGDVTRWILETSQQPQPELAVAAAITMIGTVLGQKVMTSTRARTNFYIVGIAATGAGKDHARKAIKAALTAGGMGDNLGGEDFGSGQGILARAGRCSNSIFLVDEFGDLMKTIGGKNAASHERSVMTILTKLFSSTDSVYKGTEYANQKERERNDVKYPHVSLYGTTVPSSFYPALTGDNVASGWLNRMIVVTAPPGMPVDNDDAALNGVPASIVDWIKAARGMHAGGEVGLNPEHPIQVPMDEMAKTLMVQFRTWIRERQASLEREPAKAPMADLWVRAREHALKLALIVAVGKKRPGELPQGASGDALEVDVASAVWAIDYVRHYVLEMEREISSRVGDSDLDRHCQAVMRIVRAAGLKGATQYDLNRASRSFRALEPRIQDTVFEMLKRRDDAFLVQFTSESGRGKPRMAYVASEHRDEVEAALTATVATPTTTGESGR